MILAFDPGLNGGGAILDRGELLACFDWRLPQSGGDNRHRAASCGTGKEGERWQIDLMARMWGWQ
jgi:hypothetical protein